MDYKAGSLNIVHTIKMVLHSILVAIIALIM